MVRRPLSIALFAAASFACSKPTQEENPKTVQMASESDAKKVDEAAPPPASNVPLPEPQTQKSEVVEAKPPVQELVEAKPQAPVVVEPDTLAVTPVVPVDATVVWREAATPSEKITFLYLIGGVLGEGDSGYYDIDEDGALTMRPEIEKPKAPPMGYWPDNVWYIERHFETEESPEEEDRAETVTAINIRLMRLRERSRWVPQEYEGEQRWVADNHDFLIGNKGGLLVFERDYGIENITRVAGGADSPKLGLYRGLSTEFVETNAGDVYVLSMDDGKVFVQRDCADQACVDENAIALPFKGQWYFDLPVPRQRHSVSMTAGMRGRDGLLKPHLLHYETGGWKLESLEDDPTGLWPTKDGGLWVLCGKQLLHRDPDGGWRNIALPAGASDISVAMRGDQSELWLAATVDGKPVVFATYANAQELPPEPSTVGAGAEAG